MGITTLPSEEPMMEITKNNSSWRIKLYFSKSSNIVANHHVLTQWDWNMWNKVKETLSYLPRILKSYELPLQQNVVKLKLLSCEISRSAINLARHSLMYTNSGTKISRFFWLPDMLDTIMLEILLYVLMLIIHFKSLNWMESCLECSFVGGGFHYLGS